MSVHQFPARKSVDLTIGYLGDLLLNAGFIDAKQRAELDHVERQMRHPSRTKSRGDEETPSIFKTIATLNLQDASGQGTIIDEFLLARLLAEDAALPFFKIDALKLDVEFIEKKISRPFAKKHKVVPIQMRDGKLVVAVVNPYDFSSLTDYRDIAQLELDLVVSA